VSKEEVLSLVARARDDVSGPLRRIEDALRSVGKRGSAESKALLSDFRKIQSSLRSVGKQGHDESKVLREGFHSVRREFDQVAAIAKTGVSPALEAIGISSFTAVGGVAALVAGLKGFVDQGTDVAAFGRKVMLTSDTLRGLEGVADKFHVDPGAIRAGEQSFADAMFLIRRRRGEAFRKLLDQRRDFAEELAATPETTEGNEKALKSFLKVLEDVQRVHGGPDARLWARELVGTDVFVDLLRKGNAGLEEAMKLTLKLRGAMDEHAAEKWESNWSDFKATIEGVRNEIGNDLLPDLTQLAKEAEQFFAEHKVEIAHEIVDALRDIGNAAREINAGVQATTGWKVLFEGLIALELGGLALRIASVAAALGRFAGLGTPPGWVTALLGISGGGAVAAAAGVVGLAATVYPQPAGEGDAQEKARRDAEIEASGGAKNQAEAAARGAPPAAPPVAAGVRTAIPAAFAERAAAVIQGLRDRGLDAEHAAILAGNIEQESNFDPTRPNSAEGGIGLIQWRLERRRALQELAASRHTRETDLSTQLDFMLQEIKETPEGQSFLAAQTPEEINRALKRHIRYGDNSEATRLAYGKALLAEAEKATPRDWLEGWRLAKTAMPPSALAPSDEPAAPVAPLAEESEQTNNAPGWVDGLHRVKAAPPSPPLSLPAESLSLPPLPLPAESEKPAPPLLADSLDAGDDQTNKKPGWLDNWRLTQAHTAPPPAPLPAESEKPAPLLAHSVDAGDDQANNKPLWLRGFEAVHAARPPSPSIGPAAETSDETSAAPSWKDWWDEKVLTLLPPQNANGGDNDALLDLPDDRAGSLLAAANKNQMEGWAASVTGSASISVDVKAPKGTTVKADGGDLFNRVTINRGLVMPP
jgi:hypothetical protein